MVITSRTRCTNCDILQTQSSIYEVCVGQEGDEVDLCRLLEALNGCLLPIGRSRHLGAYETEFLAPAERTAPGI